MAQLSNILIGLVVIFVFMSGLLTFAISGVVHYSPANFDNDTMQKFIDTNTETQDIINKTRTKIENSATDKGVFDIVGDFLSQAIGVFKITTSGIDAYDDSITNSVDAINIDGGFGYVLKTGAVAIIIIIFVVAIGLHIITKSDRV